MLNNKSILITGGTGSFGKKILEVILHQYKPKRIVIFSRDELKQFEMSQKWSVRNYPALEYMLGDVRDVERLKQALVDIDCVIHAAALKQVPTAEHNPEEFIKTNVLGAMNVINAALSCKVKKVVALSTDKACNPINLYGATKLCSDKLFCAASVSSSNNRTKFCVVRYGNVLGSRGSVIPFFKERAQAGVLPITDIRMTRFWITLDQSVRFVLWSLLRTRGGEIFVPKIPSMKIVDLAKAIAPHCRHEIVGIRPGEKLHETLIGEDEAHNTIEFQRSYVVQQNRKLQKELLNGRDGRAKSCPDGFKYTSDTNKEWLVVKDLRRLVEEIVDDYTIEQSRWSPKGVPQ